MKRPSSLGWALVAVATCTFAEPEPTRKCAVVVRLETSAGEPVANAGIMVYGEHDAAFVIVDANGEGSVNLGVGADDEVVTMALSTGAGPLEPGTVEFGKTRTRYLELTREFAVPRRAQVAVPAAATTATVKIVLLSPVDVTVAVTYGGARPYDAVARTRQFLSYDSTKTGVVSVPVARGLPVEIELIGDSPRRVIRRLDASQTGADFDFGVIDIPRYGEGALVRLVRVLPDDLNIWGPDFSNLAPWITCIHESGDFLYTFPVDELDGRAVPDIVSDLQQVEMEPGPYYMLPGGYPTEIGFRLMDLIVAGEGDALVAAGVPRLDLVMGENPEVTMELRAVADAIMRVPLPVSD